MFWAQMTTSRFENEKMENPEIIFHAIFVTEFVRSGRPGVGWERKFLENCGNMDSVINYYCIVVQLLRMAKIIKGAVCNSQTCRPLFARSVIFWYTPNAHHFIKSMCFHYLRVGWGWVGVSPNCARHPK